LTPGSSYDRQFCRCVGLPCRWVPSHRLWAQRARLPAQPPQIFPRGRRARRARSDAHERDARDPHDPICSPSRTRLVVPVVAFRGNAGRRGEGEYAHRWGARPWPAARPRRWRAAPLGTPVRGCGRWETRRHAGAAALAPAARGGTGPPPPCAMRPRAPCSWIVQQQAWSRGRASSIVLPIQMPVLRLSPSRTGQLVENPERCLSVPDFS
jgi:hypothetical protein